MVIEPGTLVTLSAMGAPPVLMLTTGMLMALGAGANEGFSRETVNWKLPVRPPGPGSFAAETPTFRVCDVSATGVSFEKSSASADSDALSVIVPLVWPGASVRGVAVIPDGRESVTSNGPVCP